MLLWMLQRTVAVPAPLQGDQFDLKKHTTVCDLIREQALWRVSWVPENSPQGHFSPTSPPASPGRDYHAYVPKATSDLQADLQNIKWNQNCPSGGAGKTYITPCARWGGLSPAWGLVPSSTVLEGSRPKWIAPGEHSSAAVLPG